MFSLFFLGFCGICFGVLTAAGVFTVLSAVSLVPRFIGKTHSAKEIKLYENMIIYGTTIGGIFSVVGDELRLGEFFLRTVGVSEGIWKALAFVILAAGGLFSGMLVGCLALAIAEMLDSIPIFTRRISFRHGLGLVVLCMAVGKLVGSLFYFVYIYVG
jgi:stage V sporulation protein AB